ncbi:phosphotransferase family protein [Pseudonocardia sp. TRM90224]|uniref:phosphotransferase family protein n=1 Tax=Pseudonocardia sp. TRM90224 TaxID=2812678 RepID=UPI001E4D8298|nr:phosphotransferase family protein [Pseudonocardia sp. TRM90224]
MPDGPEAVPGLDLPGLQSFFERHVAGTTGPLVGELLSGGRSNLTYRISDGASSWVLRRPPLGGLTPSAHDMRREYRVVEALHGSAVPVARPVAYTDDEEVIGAPFAVVEHVDGRVLRTQRDIRDVPTDELRQISDSLIAVMAELHRIRPDDVGLGDFGRPAGYLRRQVARWTDQWERTATTPVPDVDRLGRVLAARCPDESAHSIVHGDLRIDNTILRADHLTSVRALLDWEMATLGDPLSDLALHLVYRDEAFSPVLGGQAASTDPRMPTADHIVERYAAESGRSVDQLDFHLGLAYFKTAVIAAGIHTRHAGGHTAGGDFTGVEEAIPLLAAAGLAAYSPGR